MTDGGGRDARRTGVWSAPGMLALIVLSFTGFSGFSALFPVVPLWAVAGGADTAGAGLVNFVLLTATVATQFGVPHLIGRLGWGPVLAAGLVLLGAPSVLYLLSPGLGWILALSAIRGVGFGVLTVGASAASVLLVDPGRRGAAVGAMTLSLSLPNVVLMPMGGWIAQTLGFGPVFVLGALPLVGIAAVVALARHLPERSTRDERAPATEERPAAGGASAGTRARAYLALLPPTAILLAATLAGGAVNTFAPQLVGQAWVASAALFAMGLAGSLTRWQIGVLSDRMGIDRLLWPFIVLMVVALGAVAWLIHDGLAPGEVAVWIAGCGLVGVSYGALQNLTLLQSFAAAGPRNVGTASAVWNAGFDTGSALGSLVVGAIAAQAGFGPGLAFAAGVCALTLPLALRRRRPMVVAD